MYYQAAASKRQGEAAGLSGLFHRHTDRHTHTHTHIHRAEVSEQQSTDTAVETKLSEKTKITLLSWLSTSTLVPVTKCHKLSKKPINKSDQQV